MNNKYYYYYNNNNNNNRNGRLSRGTSKKLTDWWHEGSRVGKSHQQSHHHCQHRQHPHQHQNHVRVALVWFYLSLKYICLASHCLVIHVLFIVFLDHQVLHRFVICQKVTKLEHNMLSAVDDTLFPASRVFCFISLAFAWCPLHLASISDRLVKCHPERSPGRLCYKINPNTVHLPYDIVHLDKSCIWFTSTSSWLVLLVMVLSNALPAFCSVPNRKAWLLGQPNHSRMPYMTSHHALWQIQCHIWQIQYVHFDKYNTPAQTQCTAATF